MIGMKKKGDNLFVAYVPKTLYYEAMETNALERDQLIEVLLAHGCHQVDIADAFHGLEIGWEFREGAWHPPPPQNHHNDPLKGKRVRLDYWVFL